MRTGKQKCGTDSKRERIHIKSKAAENCSPLFSSLRSNLNSPRRRLFSFQACFVFFVFRVLIACFEAFSLPCLLLLFPLLIALMEARIIQTTTKQDANQTFYTVSLSSPFDFLVLTSFVFLFSLQAFVLEVVDHDRNTASGCSLRFSEILALHKTLSQSFVCLPPFPSRTLVRSFDPEFISERKEMLNEWFRIVTQRQDIIRTAILRRFLGERMA